MNELRNILEDSVARLFEDQVDWALVTRAEEQGWSGKLWGMAADQGLAHVLVGEEGGGMGGTWPDAFVVVRACGRYNVPLPLPEAILAYWLAEKAGIRLPDGAPGLIPRTLTAVEVAEDQINAQVERVPWGGDADFYLALAATQAGTEVILTTKEHTSHTIDQNLAREPRDTVTFVSAPVAARGTIALPTDGIRWLGALLRSAQIAGAGAACLELAVNYASEREQFGRPLSKFQAIQQNLAELAGAMASVDTVSGAAFDAMERSGLNGADRDARLEIAAAKCRASEAVEIVTRIAHQVHGAFGFTHEYSLHLSTRRLWSWRAEFGGAGEWGEYLGQLALTHGGGGIWPFITAK